MNRDTYDNLVSNFDHSYFLDEDDKAWQKAENIKQLLEKYKDNFPDLYMDYLNTRTKLLKLIKGSI